MYPRRGSKMDGAQIVFGGIPWGALGQGKPSPYNTSLVEAPLRRA